MEFISNEVFDG